MISLNIEAAVIAISKVQAAYNCTDIEAISKMQTEAAKVGDEDSIEVLFQIKNVLIEQLLKNS